MDTNYRIPYEAVKAIVLSNTPKDEAIKYGLIKSKAYDIRYQYRYFSQTGNLKPNATSYLREYLPRLKAEGVVMAEYIPSKRGYTPRIASTGETPEISQENQRDPATEIQIAFDNLKTTINRQVGRLVSQEMERQMKEIQFKVGRKGRLIR